MIVQCVANGGEYLREPSLINCVFPRYDSIYINLLSSLSNGRDRAATMLGTALYGIRPHGVGARVYVSSGDDGADVFDVRTVCFVMISA